MSDDLQWRTVCVSYHDEQAMDDLILDAVRPLFRDIGGDAYFVRHWRRGPHLRLNVRATPDRWHDTVLSAVERRIGDFLLACPSQSTIDFYRLLPTHLSLAEAEQDDGPLWPPRPDNTVDVEPYDARAEVLGGPEAADFIAGFHVAATSAAFAALEEIRTERQRLWTAFELMAATAHAFSGGGVRLGFVSFRAHAEIFLARSLSQRRVRSQSCWLVVTASTPPPRIHLHRHRPTRVVSIKSLVTGTRR